MGYEQQDRDEEEELSWKRELQDQGLLVTDVRDRQYFKSIYFREPGGTLFEIATDPPGFTWDESEEKLGQALKLINFKFLTLSFIC
ncbi:catechol-2,3-dioxygenase [Caldalkalibacillus uzonensis]|uniref:Catechol-2,3-dioxygenase n=1 Tax=Caldalkalibacillus uzonensis TaxID=353224 RepID=A0ABU0CM53_9BACI|nr:VOC family protein [Caldalkalibacillus uzonensis]MDQ0337493.1 catechol-2,3-dioxygenase [Caldalkalibacillus uzonensis]